MGTLQWRKMSKLNGAGQGAFRTLTLDRVKLSELTQSVLKSQVKSLHVTTKGGPIMPTPISDRVQKHRQALRAAGLRPVQIWVPDTRRPGFLAECRRQAALVSAADKNDADLSDFMDAALSDLDDWQ